MSFYSEIADTALKLLTKFGQDVTLRQFSPGGGGGYNTGTGKVVANAQPGSNDLIRKAVIVDAPQNRIGPQYGTNMKKDTLIQDITKWAYMDANGPAPRVNDKLIVRGIEYVIINVQEHNPGGTPLMYQLEIGT